MGASSDDHRGWESRPAEPMPTSEDIAIPVPVPGGTVQGLLFRPAGDGPRPTVVLGDEDAAVPNEVQAELYAELRRWDVPATIKVYPGAGHVFAGKHFGDAYRAEADEESWARAVDFARGARTR